MYDIEEFKRKYSELEQWATDEGYEDVADLERHCTKRSISDELYFYRRIRNFLTHNPKAKERLTLTDAFYKDFDELCNYFMADITDVAIPAKDIFRREMTDTLGPTIRIMKERVFTHAPVMMNRKVWGVFSENTLFELAEKEEFAKYDSNTRFMDLAPYITNFSKSSVYDFIGRGATLEQVKEKFSKAAKEGRKLEVVFITTTGTKDGDLTGMVTIWDLATV